MCHVCEFLGRLLLDFHFDFLQKVKGASQLAKSNDQKGTSLVDRVNSHPSDDEELPDLLSEAAGNEKVVAEEPKASNEVNSDKATMNSDVATMNSDVATQNSGVATMDSDVATMKCAVSNKDSQTAEEDSVKELDNGPAAQVSCAGGCECI